MPLRITGVRNCIGFALVVFSGVTLGTFVTCPTVRTATDNVATLTPKNININDFYERVPRASIRGDIYIVYVGLCTSCFFSNLNMKPINDRGEDVYVFLLDKLPDVGQQKELGSTGAVVWTPDSREVLKQINPRGPGDWRLYGDGTLVNWAGSGKGQ
jgi:hypothetical protein